MPREGESFGDWLINELRRRGVEVTDFARDLGIQTSTIYRWQQTNPRLSMVGKVTRALGDVSYDDTLERFGMTPKRKRDGSTVARRLVDDLARLPEDVYAEIIRESEEKRREGHGNRKETEH